MQFYYCLIIKHRAWFSFFSHPKYNKNFSSFYLTLFIVSELKKYFVLGKVTGVNETSKFIDKMQPFYKTWVIKYFSKKMSSISSIVYNWKTSRFSKSIQPCPEFRNNLKKKKCLLATCRENTKSINDPNKICDNHHWIVSTWYKNAQSCIYKW